MANRPEPPVPVPKLAGHIFCDKLGAGSYGTVYKAKYVPPSTGRPSSAAPTHQFFCAIKCINRKALTKTTQDLLINEIKILKHVKHENIVEMYDFQWDENYIYIVMEYCAGGDMSHFIRSRQQLSEARARPFVQQIARVLKFLYEKRISHMDLKPENILLTSVDKPQLKVADFGVAQHIGKHGSRSIRGTLLYMAPEILSSRPYDNRVDLWSMGVILYECLFGRPPFIFSTVDELVEAIQSPIPIEIPADARISPECRDLLTGLLKRNPDNRISFQDFFRHPFIVSDVNAYVARADALLQKSIDYEAQNNLKKALDYRVRALDEYVSILKVDIDEDRRRTLRMKVKHGLAASEILKKRIRDSATATRPSSTTAHKPPAPTVIPTNDYLTNDRKLSAAYQHCLNGNQWMNSFQYGRACEEFEIGLDTMLRAAKIETDPTKQKILHGVISHFLGKAEECKEKHESQQVESEMDKIKNDSALEGTITDDSNVNTEKKSDTPSATAQSCSLQ